MGVTCGAQRHTHSSPSHQSVRARPITRATVSASLLGGEALRPAEELLADIEMKRLESSEIVLKASRLARLAKHGDLQTF
ncbi:hypothetical protein [Nocardia amamiensis]|uniref:hypothetical protein n=1 Tax=Nocardia amamiensis TaxID=404578 RepID=UPI0012F4E780|nr:hypothetical protein [Nocardia amamiensis]